MDEISFLLNETLKDHEIRQKHIITGLPGMDGEESAAEQKGVARVPAPETSGLIYHLQKQNELFIIRTLPSSNLALDLQQILFAPDAYPSLRLGIETQPSMMEDLKFTPMSLKDAEFIHAQIGHRRFPLFEERVCNLSDPGFSWWLSDSDEGLMLSLRVIAEESDHAMKLGTLGDVKETIEIFKKLSELCWQHNLPLSASAESHRVLLNSTEEFIREDFRNVFELGVISEELEAFFGFLAMKSKEESKVEELWNHFQSMALLRRFWIQISLNLSKESN